EAVMARDEPSFMSGSGAFTTSLTGAFSAGLIFISPPSRAFSLNIPPATPAMGDRPPPHASAFGATIEAVKRKAIARAPALPPVITAIIVLPLLQLRPAS